MSHRYGTLSKGYTGAKCWQMCEMNPCMHNNKISCPGTSRLNGKIWNWKKNGLKADLMGCLRKQLTCCYWAFVEALCGLSALGF